MTLNGFQPAEQTLFGSMLFARGVTGARYVRPTNSFIVFKERVIVRSCF